MNNLWNVFLIFYFLFSKRVDLVLVNDFSTFRPKQVAIPFEEVRGQADNCLRTQLLGKRAHLLDY